MPVIRDDVSTILADALKTLFFEALASQAPTDHTRLVTVAPSGKGRDSEKYGWLSPTKQPREFKDTRVPQGLVDHDYTIKNLKWEDTLAIEREAVDSDQYGQIRLRIQQLAWANARFKHKKVIQALANGFTAKCYDGQYFFDTDHEEGKSGTQSNKLTDALTPASLKSAIIKMQTFVDEEGEPLGLVPDLLVVPPALRFTAKEILTSGVVVAPVGSGTASTGATASTPYTNSLQGELDLLVSPYLTDVSDWFILCTNAPLRPLILQQSDALEFTALDKLTDLASFMEDKYVYGTRERFNVGYGLWQMAVGSSVT